ncbi:MAG: MobC family plasmid mobilization relaxosome protein [Oligoflexia bacterium]|nr:MobC family plasmid mobilization relaxosome protein [Oligoflexia bacterium]
MFKTKEIKKCVIPVRFTERERERLYELGKRHSLSLSSLIRRLSLKKRLPPARVQEINLKTYQELCRIGNNLNQLVRAVHQWQIPDDYTEQFQELKSIIKKVSFEVIGETCDS